MMATGDNLLTGVSVAHKWGILTTDHYILIDEDKESKEIKLSLCYLGGKYFIIKLSYIFLINILYLLNLYHFEVRIHYLFWFS